MNFYIVLQAMYRLIIQKLYKKHNKKKLINKKKGNINLKIEPYKFTAIIGRSGSGKSSLLHCMAGLDKPTDRKVFMDDLDLYIKALI